jgi:ATP-dependent RNA helicase RhlE
LLPLLHKLTTGKRPVGTKILVLSPTRELANQTDAACRQFAAKGISCTSIIGGTGYKAQANALRRQPTIIVATPGRLIDFMEQGLVELSGLTTLVLDEADRMLDMGFLPAIKRIVKAVPTKRQTLFFSATMSSEIERIAYSMLKDPEFIEVSPRGSAAVTVHQTAYSVDQASKTKRPCSSICSKGRNSSVCLYLQGQNGLPTGSPTSSRNATIAQIGSTATVRNRSERLPLRPLKTAKQGFWSQPTSQPAASI